MGRYTLVTDCVVTVTRLFVYMPHCLFTCQVLLSVVTSPCKQRIMVWCATKFINIFSTIHLFYRMCLYLDQMMKKSYYKILHMSRQHSCRDMCKNLLWSDGWNLKCKMSCITKNKLGEMSSQWKTSLQNNVASHWLSINLESALWYVCDAGLWSLELLYSTACIHIMPGNVGGV